jgi:hypothetical protein
MLIKVYILLWFVVAAAAGVVFSAGFFNEMWLTIFGFLFSTLFFMGFVAVLPWWLSQPFSPKH